MHIGASPVKPSGLSRCVMSVANQDTFRPFAPSSPPRVSRWTSVHYCTHSFVAAPAPFLLPTNFILWVPCAHCLFSPIATYSRVSDYGTDAPLIHWLHRTHFASLQCPHHLIIALPFYTLRVATFSFVLISNRRVQPVPPTIQRPMDLQHLFRRF